MAYFGLGICGVLERDSEGEATCSSWAGSIMSLAMVANNYAATTARLVIDQELHKFC